MKHNIFKRIMSLFLALVCVMGILPLSAFAAGLSTAPATITQKDCDYMYVGGRPVRYYSANATINSHGQPYVFDEQVNVPGFGATRALCAYQIGTLGSGANGQQWKFKRENTNPSLKALFTYVHSFTYDTFTDAAHAIGITGWGADASMWSDAWFMVAQAMTWYDEYGLIIDYTQDKEGFIKQAAAEMVL